MDELVAFLRARLDEDEADAKAASLHAMAWHLKGSWYLDGVEHQVVGEEEAFCHPHNAAHIARHDPARVLAEIDAKREILRLHADSSTALMAASGTVLAGGVKVRRRAYEDVLKLLALPYADHPDYREEWRP